MMPTLGQGFTCTAPHPLRLQWAPVQDKVRPAASNCYVSNGPVQHQPVLNPVVQAKTHSSFRRLMLDEPLFWLVQTR